MVLKQFGAMFKARTMEFVRDRGTFIWNLIFPFVLVFGFAFAFGGGNGSVFRVGFVGSIDAGSSFAQVREVSFIDYNELSQGGGSSDASVSGTASNPAGATAGAPAADLSSRISPAHKSGLEAALRKLSQHEIDLVVDWQSKRYWSNQESANSRVAQRLFEGLAAESALAGSGFTRESISGQAVRYVDRLVPGVIGMNMMFSCLFGVGFVLVRYRKNGVLKRLKATPVSALNFVAAQALSRLTIVAVTSVFVFVGSNIFLNFINKGSYFNLFLLLMLSVTCMISIGLLFASRFKSEELVSGILNLLTFPMLILSGVFFSLEGSPAVLTSIAQIFPLTHFVDGARAIMIDGAGFGDILPNLLYLGGFTVVALIVTAFTFKWE